jgi:hypothetical protein
MAQAPTRAPRGTRQIVKAFHDALGSVPEGNRTQAARAALTKIREDLKAVREKARAQKERTGSRSARQAKPTRRTASRSRKPERGAEEASGYED